MSTAARFPFRVIEGGRGAFPPPPPPPPLRPPSPVPPPWRIGLALCIGVPAAACIGTALFVGAIGLALCALAERLVTPPAERRRIRQEPRP